MRLMLLALAWISLWLFVTTPKPEFKPEPKPEVLCDCTQDGDILWCSGKVSYDI